MAAGITATSSLALTLFAIQTNRDFTMMGSFLYWATVALLILGIAAMFIRNPILQIVYGCIGALIFCMYHVRDTQLMIGGQHKYIINPEKYIVGAVCLFLDILNIFLFILRIINNATAST